MTHLNAEEIAKLRWAYSHPHVKIDEFDAVGESLCERGYLNHYDAGYVDWYGYWVTISPRGYKALLIAAAETAQGIEARSAETQGGSAVGESPSALGGAPDPKREGETQQKETAA